MTYFCLTILTIYTVYTLLYILFYDDITSIPSSSFDRFCFEFQCAWNWFFFLKERVYLIRFFLFVILRNHQMILEQVEKILWKNNLGAYKVNFAAFSCAIRNWCEKLCIAHVVGIPLNRNLMGKTYPYMGKKMGSNFPGSPNSMNSLHSFMLWEIDGESHVFQI